MTIKRIQPPEGSSVAGTDPLQKLKQVSKQDSIVGKLQALPREKIEDVREYLYGLEGFNCGYKFFIVGRFNSAHGFNRG